jgi:hypothetical protein
MGGQLAFARLGKQLEEWDMGGLRRDNMLILYGMGGRERLFIDGMGGFIHGWEREIVY